MGGYDVQHDRHLMMLRDFELFPKEMLLQFPLRGRKSRTEVEAEFTDGSCPAENAREFTQGGSRRSFAVFGNPPRVKAEYRQDLPGIAFDEPNLMLPVFGTDTALNETSDPASLSATNHGVS